MTRVPGANLNGLMLPPSNRHGRFGGTRLAVSRGVGGRRKIRDRVTPKVRTPNRVMRHTAEGQLLASIEELRQIIRILVQRDEAFVSDIDMLESKIVSLLLSGADLKRENERLVQEGLTAITNLSELKRNIAQIQREFEDLQKENRLLESTVKGRDAVLAQVRSLITKAGSQKNSTFQELSSLLFTCGDQQRTSAQNRQQRHLDAIIEQSDSSQESLEASVGATLKVNDPDDIEEKNRCPLQRRETAGRRRHCEENIPGKPGSAAHEDPLPRLRSMRSDAKKRKQMPTLVTSTTITVTRGSEDSSSLKPENQKPDPVISTPFDVPAKRTEFTPILRPSTPSASISRDPSTVGGILSHSRKSRPLNLQEPDSPITLRHYRRSRALLREKGESLVPASDPFASIPGPIVVGSPSTTSPVCNPPELPFAFSGTKDGYARTNEEKCRRQGGLSSSSTASPVDLFPQTLPRSTFTKFENAGERRFAPIQCEVCRATFHPKCIDENSQCPGPCARLRDAHKNPLVAHCPTRPPYVPALIEACVQELEKRGLRQHHLYRTTRPDKVVQEMVQNFTLNGAVPNLSKIDVHVLASVIKKFLDSLSHNLIPTSAWDAFATAVTQNREAVRNAWAEKAIRDLPGANKHTLATLILHLKNVADNYSEIKMLPHSLGKVLGRTIVGYRNGDPDPDRIISETNIQNRFIDTLFINIGSVTPAIALLYPGMVLDLGGFDPGSLDPGLLDPDDSSMGCVNPGDFDQRILRPTDESTAAVSTQ
ncbi:unnamed protein product [Cyprideis torosa]|uniref:Uncharacterized protein n=1 Tax=Cyprideis torosa TaxID=163714 RepID=A0A7R8WDN5_9CRUS|nr:unnamed protein product [Cyprideis torosa]CAG0889754.1 unnamed protein product [Cyprideis torosa]